MTIRTHTRLRARSATALLAGVSLTAGMSMIAVPHADADGTANPCVTNDSTVTCTYSTDYLDPADPTSGLLEQTFTVPAGVTSVQVTAVGGHGAAGWLPDDRRTLGGSGARVTSTLEVSGLTTLYVEVGSNGVTSLSSRYLPAVGIGGGGAMAGGGGATVIQSQSCLPVTGATIGNCIRSAAPGSLLLVAGGGGGGGYFRGGGTGGSASADGTANGADGTKGDAGSGGGGGGGTTSAGGAAGFATSTPSAPGSFGLGGSALGAGGGGGGYYGGGGGGMGNTSGGGGGAGSSYVDPDLTSDTRYAADTTGTPTVIISYTVPAEERLTALGRSVQGVGPGHSLANKVSNTLAYLAAGDTAQACTELAGFVNQVRAQSGKKIAPATATELVDDAVMIERTIGC